MHLNNSNLEDIPQPSYRETTSMKDDCFLSTDRLPWKIFNGCNQGHSTGIVRPIENSHKLIVVELHCLVGFFM